MDKNIHAHTAHIPQSTEAAHIGVEVNEDDYILGHGASRFLRPERYQDLKRKGAGATSQLASSSTCQHSGRTAECFLNYHLFLQPFWPNFICQLYNTDL